MKILVQKQVKKNKPVKTKNRGHYNVQNTPNWIPWGNFESHRLPSEEQLKKDLGSGTFRFNSTNRFKRMGRVTIS